MVVRLVVIPDNSVIYERLTVGASLAKREVVMIRILVVDDEPGIRFAFRQYFGRKGFTVDCAETQKRAAEVGVHSFLRKPARLAKVAEIAFGLVGAV